METLFFLSLQHVTHSDPVTYDNEERYRRFRELLPAPLGNTFFDFSSTQMTHHRQAMARARIE